MITRASLTSKMHAKSHRTSRRIR